MKILLIRNDVLGDAVISSTFVESLAKLLNCQIDLLCNHYNEIAFRYNPYINKIYKIQHEQHSKKLAVDYKQVISQINQDNTDIYACVFVLNDCIRNFKYANLIKTNKIFTKKLVTKKVSSNMWTFIHKFYPKFHFFAIDTKIHEALKLHQLLIQGLSNLNIDTNNITLPKTCHFYLKNTVIQAQKSCVINISGKQDKIRYINDNMLYALLENIDKYNITKVLIIAMEIDRVRLNKILEHIHTNLSIDVLINNDLMLVAETMANYQVYVGCDGGLLHLASGLNLACIALFNQQDTNIWHPWTPKQISLQTPSKNIYDINYIDVLDSINLLKQRINK